MLTEATGNYLKAIYKLRRGTEKVTTQALSKRLHVTPASVTGMLKKLGAAGLVRYAPYRGVELTAKGQKAALEIIRHHRLLELYLNEVVGLSWDKVDAEAEKLEHVISEEFEEKMDEALGRPRHDPHGDPIPTKEGVLREEPLEPLATMQPGQSAVVRGVSDRDPERLRYLAVLGLTPNATVHLIEVFPFGGPLRVRVGEGEHSLGPELARDVFVVPIPG